MTTEEKIGRIRYAWQSEKQHIALLPPRLFWPKSTCKRKKLPSVPISGEAAFPLIILGILTDGGKDLSGEDAFVTLLRSVWNAGLAAAAHKAIHKYSMTMDPRDRMEIEAAIMELRRKEESDADGDRSG